MFILRPIAPGASNLSSSGDSARRDGRKCLIWCKFGCRDYTTVTKRPRAVGAATGYALRGADSANGINRLHDHQFAQLDAHNAASALACGFPSLSVQLSPIVAGHLTPQTSSPFSLRSPNENSCCVSSTYRFSDAGTRCAIRAQARALCKKLARKYRVGCPVAPAISIWSRRLAPEHERASSTWL